MLGGSARWLLIAGVHWHCCLIIVFLVAGREDFRLTGQWRLIDLKLGCRVGFIVGIWRGLLFVEDCILLLNDGLCKLIVDDKRALAPLVLVDSCLARRRLLGGLGG